MQMTDMKRSHKKAEQAETAMGPSGTEESYPWGLQLHLEDEEIQKLGLKGKLPVGGELLLSAAVKVTNYGESANEREERCSASLQITRMALGPMPQERRNTEDVLYEKG